MVLGVKMSGGLMLFLMFAVWVGAWIGSGIYYKKNNHTQPFGRGFLAGMCVTLIVMLVLQFLFPTRDELLKKAQEAEKNYFLLSAVSLNHDKICSAAYRAGKLYSQLEDEEKVKMFNYILMTDKCL